MERAEGQVRPLVALEVAEGLILARDRPDPVTFAVQPDHVLGVSPPALLLARLTVRRPVGRVLDLGCGGGVQALLAARHAQSVVGVDLNPRALAFARFNARLNGIRNVEWREGDLFAPVAGERFDLVVSNPPYVVSPESWLLFRDGGGAGDGICARIVGGLGSHLAEGGFATVLANWGLREGEPWSDRPRRWVEGTGCDAWILRWETQDALTYAAAWTRGPEAAGYVDALERWTAHYEALGIRSLVMGALVLRKRTAGPGWVRADELPAPPAAATPRPPSCASSRARTGSAPSGAMPPSSRRSSAPRSRCACARRSRSATASPRCRRPSSAWWTGSRCAGAPTPGPSASSSCATAGGAFARSWRRWPARPGPTRASLTGPTLAVARRLVALGFLVPADR